MWNNAKARADREGVEFSITLDDIVIPDLCPVLGVPLVQRLGKQGGGPQSPSLDRVIPHLGYTPDNVAVMSMRANRIKNNATLGELSALVAFLEGRAAAPHGHEVAPAAHDYP